MTVVYRAHNKVSSIHNRLHVFRIQAVYSLFHEISSDKHFIFNFRFNIAFLMITGSFMIVGSFNKKSLHIFFIMTNRMQVDGCPLFTFRSKFTELFVINSIFPG